MQSIKYREVLNAVAYRLGYDPLDPNFPRDEAQSIGTYIDQWVTRLYPARDWPEWTHVKRFQPNANHIVTWTQLSPDTTNPLSAFPATLTMWRVMAVYIVDPRSVYGANSTKFYLREEGVHCGFEHGTNVWIKYIEPPPRFTSVEWASNVVYRKDDVVYSITTGEVYKSKSNNNLNHDPTAGASLGAGVSNGGSTFLSTEVLQQKSVSQLGTPSQDKIMTVRINRTTDTDVTIPDPPPNLANFRISVDDATGANLGTSFKVANGVLTLAAIATDLASQLTVALGAGWTVTADPTLLTVTIQNASDFRLINPNGQDWPLYFSSATSAAHPLQFFQVQAYVPAVTNSVITPQIIQTTFSGDQLVAGALYSFEFKDLSGVDHLATYQSNSGDGQNQIISGILSAVSNSSQDNYFQTVQVSANPTTPSLTFTVSDHASLNALFTLPGSPWWDVVPFPLALYEQVVIGAFSDALMDWGQADKASAEKQGVGIEADSAAQKFTYPPVTPLTGQVTGASRYKRP